jgi:hypothetical protein
VAEALETVLADWRETATALRRADSEKAALVDRICDAITAAAEDYLRWLSEADARLRSGWGLQRLRAHFPEWERGGNARRNGRKREYRQVVIPQRANTIAARDAGRAAGRLSA